MATLTADSPRVYELGEFNELPVVASDIIYEGSAVGDSSGYARPLVAADAFQGFANRKADNSSGSAGDINVQVRQKGFIVMPVTGVTAVTDEGSTVYASDDNTLTLTSTSNSTIGKVARFISGTTVLVYFEAAALRSV